MTLSLSTIFLVISLNFVAVGTVWIFVWRCYPNFPAATSWAASSFTGVAGGVIWLIRDDLPPLVAVTLGNGFLVMMAWLSWTGLRQFYHKWVPWWVVLAAPVVVVAVLAFFTFVYDDVRLRVVFYSVCQSVPVLLMAREVLTCPKAHRSHGALLALGTMASLVGVYVLRSVAVMFDLGGDFLFGTFNNLQALLIVILAFIVMVCSFSFLLMAIDRLRQDVAALALSDDLTGVANRRHLLKRLADECALSSRTRMPFAILVMDLDEFKMINDCHGHAAGDECLRAFSGIVQDRLRSSDLLARIGGDEFCVVLPGTAACEASVVAGDLIAICSRVQVLWNGAAITLRASIGVAQWPLDVCDTPERIMAAADQALYDAKRHGKAQLALHDGGEPVAGDVAPPVQAAATTTTTMVHLRSA